MFNFIVLFLFLSTGGVFSATILKRKFEEGIPLYFLGVTFFLYLFYIFDFLKLGLFIIVFASFIFYILSISYVIKNKNFKEVIKRLVTPGTLCFIIIYFIMWFLTRNSLLYLFDELRLWGAYPKVLYFTDKIQLGETLLYDGMSMNTYLPGMPLFQYFCMKILRGFQENYLHFSFCLLGASLFLPLLKSVEWKKSYMIIPYVLFIVFTPMIFYNNGFDEGYYYKSLFIDSILGLAIGYNFYLLCKNPYENKFNIINYMLSLSLVYLLKENGIIFVLISLFFSIVMELFYYKNKDYKKIKNYKSLIIPIIFVLFLIISWKVTLNVYNKTSDVTSEFNVGKMIDLVSNPTDEQKSIMKKHISITNTYPVIGSNIEEFNKHLTYKNVIISVIIISIIIIILVPKKEKLKYSFALIAIVGQSIAYWLALLFLYALKYGDVLCFQRYNNTTLLAIFMFLGLILIERVIKNDKKMLKLLIVLLSFVVLIPFRSIGKTTLNSVTPDYDYENVTGVLSVSKQHEQKITSAIGTSEKTTNIYFASYEQYPIVHHRLYNQLLDDNIKIKNIFGCITDWSSKEAFVRSLLYENYDYVYVYNYNEAMKTFSEGLFEHGIKESTLYKIEKNDNTITLKEV